MDDNQPNFTSCSENSATRFLTRINEICQRYERSCAEKGEVPIVDIRNFRVLGKTDDTKSSELVTENDYIYKLSDCESEGDYASDSSYEADSRSISLISSNSSQASDCDDVFDNDEPEFPIACLDNYSKTHANKSIDFVRNNSTSTPKTDVKSGNQALELLPNLNKSLRNKYGVVVKLYNGDLFMNAIHETSKIQTKNFLQNLSSKQTESADSVNSDGLEACLPTSAINHIPIRPFNVESGIPPFSEEEDLVEDKLSFNDPSINTRGSNLSYFKVRKMYEMQMKGDENVSSIDNEDKLVSQKFPPKIKFCDDQISFLEECDGLEPNVRARDVSANRSFFKRARRSRELKNLRAGCNMSVDSEDFSFTNSNNAIGSYSQSAIVKLSAQKSTKQTSCDF